ncbi:MAG: hypothetical protein IPJ19_17795 [Planctomycetes bacterium]|nr:hypothetical protein [Planctomycetota bacterium]
MQQVLSIVGAVLILVAYAANQRGKLGRADVSYNLLNLVGSGVLAWIAIDGRQWGFVLLECSWALLSVPPLLKRATAT